MKTDTEIKYFDFETKELADSGHFEGFAAVYGNIDQGGDIIERGAFRKTVSEKNHRAPVFHEHKIAVGAATLEDTEYGLKAIGELNLDKQSSRDAYSDLKFYRDRGIKTGMSIGFRPVIAPEYKDGVRILRELKLYEVTLTLMPMNEKAEVRQVKSSMDSMEAHLEAWQEIQAELKSGRKISKERAIRLRTAANEILSLLSEAGADEATTAEGADGKSLSEPDTHSAAKILDALEGMRSLLSAA